MTSAFDFEENLISEVRQSPTLYDHSRGEYREQVKVEDAWKAIASKLTVSVRECKTRWKSLRDTYVRKIRSAQRNPALFEEKKKWRYLDQMAFLDAFLKILLPVGELNLPESNPTDVIVITAKDEDDKTDTNSDTVSINNDQNHVTPNKAGAILSRKRKLQLQMPSSPQPATTSSSSSSSSNDYDFKKLCHELMENKRVLDTYASERDDEHFLFGRQVSLMLKRIGGLERYTAQIEIMEVLMARMPASETSQ